MGGLDFNRLNRRSAADNATEPRRIFSALPSKDPKYGYPRDVQTEVWEQWHERRADHDLVIKMNTGGGKTVVGLIVLKSCVNDGAGPVGYFTPDTYLAEQVREEARGLGIETTDDPRSVRFQTGKAILVTNIYRLVNGLSVFGVAGDPRQAIELGTILIDDAHACLATVGEQFTLRIPADHPAYGELRKLFDEELSRQSPAGARDLKEWVASVALRIPYWAWADSQEKVLAALHPHREEDAFKFVWPLVADCLPICLAAVTAEAIEIKPPCPPIGRIRSFERAKRRLYLTATLADDSVLITHFAANSTSISSPITPKTADDLGDRMILTPMETHPEVDDEDIRGFLHEQAERHNVVVIVPSYRRSEFWRPYAAAIHDSRTIREGVEALRRGHVGLVVLVNKYDGVDLPYDACRILALDGLPEAYGALDRIEALALDNSDAMLTRQIQRIEQGMGRGVRSNDDYCVVMLLGSRLTQRLHSAAGAARFGPATRAQLALSGQVAEMLHGRPLSELAAVVDQCLSRDGAWVAASRSALDGLTYDGGRVSPVAVAERQAFDLAEARRYSEAHDRLQLVTNTVTDMQLRGWLKQQAAAYLYLVDPAAAQKLQSSAQTDNRAVLKPREGISYARLKASMSQAYGACFELESRYHSANELLVGFNAILDDLKPDPDPQAVNSFEQAMHDLGIHLGFTAQRPERDTGEGPDVLWLLGDLNFLVIECKSGVTTDFISRHDVSQLSYSTDWFFAKYDKTCHASPILVHPTFRLHKAATARSGTRVITFDRLAELRAAVRQFAEALARNESYRDREKVAEQLNSRDLNGGAFVNRWSMAPRLPRKE